MKVSEYKTSTMPEATEKQRLKMYLERNQEWRGNQERHSLVLCACPLGDATRKCYFESNSLIQAYSSTRQVKPNQMIRVLRHLTDGKKQQQIVSWCIFFCPLVTGVSLPYGGLSTLFPLTKMFSIVISIVPLTLNPINKYNKCSTWQCSVRHHQWSSKCHTTVV